MIGWLNIGSLVLGLVAWILPIINLTQFTKDGRNHWVVLSMMSLSACATSLLFQIINTYNRVQIEDWSALMDIVGAKVLTAAVLLIVTIILNVMTLIAYRKRTLR
jgi:hypothetical protein